MDEKAEKNIITVSSTENTIYANNGSKISFDTSILSGTKLTLSNGEIVIGSGVSKVLINAGIDISYGATVNKTYEFSIRKSNGSINTYGFVIKTLNDVGATGSISPRIIEVQQGDTIYMYFRTDSSNVPVNGKNTYITVEVIE